MYQRLFFIAYLKENTCITSFPKGILFLKLYNNRANKVRMARDERRQWLRPKVSHNEMERNGKAVSYPSLIKEIKPMLR